MKTNAFFFLFLFSVFIVAPTVIRVYDNEGEIIEFSMGEEEKTDASITDAEKHPVETLDLHESLRSGIQNTIPLTCFQPLWDTLYPDTFSPPPEQA
ncbi:MAG: hypothetical protein KTR22_07050 [Flavobacteriaceae bacterium]|nr:hypothetical protein [Flavobacteriaceae bacterium]